MKRISYLGPAGTYAEEAAILYDPQAQKVPCPTIAAAVAAVEQGAADEGVVPIENSIEGSVTDTLDLLIHESRLLICHELVLPIQHYLMVKPGTQAGQVRVIFSHPQALGQCRRTIERDFPQAMAVAALSTSFAVEQMMSSSVTAAAIANKRSAELYGAEILTGDIQDRPANATRFVVLAPTDSPPTGYDKTSLAFTFNEDKPGILHSVLGEFALRHINLAKIESRPSKESLGRYFFLVDLEGHREDKIVAEALEQVRAETSLLKVFGSYPRYRPLI